MINCCNQRKCFFYFLCSSAPYRCEGPPYVLSGIVAYPSPLDNLLKVNV